MTMLETIDLFSGAILWASATAGKSVASIRNPDKKAMSVVTAVMVPTRVRFNENFRAGTGNSGLVKDKKKSPVK